MVKTTLALGCVLCVALVAPLAAEDGGLLKFDGGIGSFPAVTVVSNTGVVTVTRNTVRGVAPGGLPWVIKALKAEVATDGRINVRGRGLLLGARDAIGTNAGQSVFASLFCGTVEHSTDKIVGVPLDANGDFHINDMLSGAPIDTCDNPVLLIRNLGGAWFAAGIVKHDNDK